jgi:hypothetical protein
MIYHFKKQVAVAGTAAPIAAVSIKCAWVTFWPAQSDGSANSGEVRIGGGQVNLSTGAVTFPPTSIAAGLGMPLSPGDSGVAWNEQAPNAYDLSNIYIDADNADDGVQGVYGVV